MEPTIYKPSIYKGAGIYKVGAEGGGGISSNYICGKTYTSVIMPDGKEWTVENLDLGLTNNNGAAYYNNDENTYGWEGKRYGQLYTQDLILSLQGIFGDWRIPTDSDFSGLISAISTDVAYKLKSKTGWQNGNGIDAFGFNAVPAGNKTSNVFYSIGVANTFWTSTYTVSYYLDGGNNLNRDTTGSPFNARYSIRLVRDV